MMAHLQYVLVPLLAAMQLCTNESLQMAHTHTHTACSKPDEPCFVFARSHGDCLSSAIDQWGIGGWPFEPF